MYIFLHAMIMCLFNREEKDQEKQVKNMAN